MYPAKQTFLVLGLSRSGCAAAEFLLERKAKVYIYDDVPGEGVEKSARLLAKPIEKIDYDKMSSCAVIFHLAAYWNAKKSGIIE